MTPLDPFGLPARLRLYALALRDFLGRPLLTYSAVLCYSLFLGLADSAMGIRPLLPGAASAEALPEIYNALVFASVPVALFELCGSLGMAGTPRLAAAYGWLSRRYLLNFALAFAPLHFLALAFIPFPFSFHYPLCALFASVFLLSLNAILTHPDVIALADCPAAQMAAIAKLFGRAIRRCFSLIPGKLRALASKRPAKADLYPYLPACAFLLCAYAILLALRHCLLAGAAPPDIRPASQAFLAAWDRAQPAAACALFCVLLRTRFLQWLPMAACMAELSAAFEKRPILFSALFSCAVLGLALPLDMAERLFAPDGPASAGVHAKISSSFALATVALFTARIFSECAAAPFKGLYAAGAFWIRQARKSDPDGKLRAGLMLETLLSGARYVKQGLGAACSQAKSHFDESLRSQREALAKAEADLLDKSIEHPPASAARKSSKPRI